MSERITFQSQFFTCPEIHFQDFLQLCSFKIQSLLLAINTTEIVTLANTEKNMQAVSVFVLYFMQLYSLVGKFCIFKHGYVSVNHSLRQKYWHGAMCWCQMQGAEDTDIHSSWHWEMMSCCFLGLNHCGTHLRHRLVLRTICGNFLYCLFMFPPRLFFLLVVKQGVRGSEMKKKYQQCYFS